MPGPEPMPKATGIALAGFAATAALAVWQGRDPADPGLGATALAAGFLVFMHLPVRWRTPVEQPGWAAWLPAGLLYAVGSAAGITFVQAAGWLWAWSRWTRSAVAASALPVERSWLAFAFLFPWITRDFPAIGWWFRLSGAAVCGALFEGLGFPVEREGTSLVVGGLPVHVEAACAGMSLLQAMMVAGTVLALAFFPKSRAFFPAFAAMPVLAWAANCARITLITAVALSAGVEFSQGLFHTWGALIVIGFMLAFAIIVLVCARAALRRLRP